MFSLLKQKAVVVVTGLAMVVGTMGVVGIASATPTDIMFTVSGAGGSPPSTPRTVTIEIDHATAAAQCAANSICLKKVTIDLQGGTDTNASWV